MSDPEQLIDERVPTRFLRYLTSQLNRSRFKKSGEFDRLRRELLAEFQRSERIGGFQSRVYDIARQRLASDPRLINLSQDGIYRELMGEIDRYPVLERAVAEAPLLSDPSFAETIRVSVQRILEESESHGERRDPG